MVDIPDRLKLSMRCDPLRSKRDLDRVGVDEWQPHFNTSYYVGDWSGVALREPENAHQPLYPDPTAENFRDSEALGRCTYIPELLADLHCPHETVRFLKLGPGSEIQEHRDYRLGFSDGVARLHAPIVTGPDVEFILNGKSVEMAAGEIWYLDFNQPHSVVNRGKSERVHLVIDVCVNDWLTERFIEALNDVAESRDIEG